MSVTNRTHYTICHWHNCQFKPWQETPYCEEHYKLVYPAEFAVNCIACGQYHGSMNDGRRCLENEIRRIRAAVLGRV